MTKTIIITCLFLSQVLFCFGQKTVPIYELGDSIIEYESNFKNLFKNWTPKNITNASDYVLENFSFIESISDSIVFNFYRNYFSSIETLSKTQLVKGGSNSWGAHYRHIYIEPHFTYKEFFEQGGFSSTLTEIFSAEFKSKGIDILTHFMNLDSLDLKYYYSEINESVSEYETDMQGNQYKKGESYSSSKRMVALPDSISKNYMDIYLNQEKKFEDLTVLEKRSYLLEDLLNQRILTQLNFNDQIEIGDKVYKIEFKYKSKPYSCYVICNATTKKVKWDYFFKDITVDTDNN